jgi:hypothetical protein
VYVKRQSFQRWNHFLHATASQSGEESYARHPDANENVARILHRASSLYNPADSCVIARSYRCSHMQGAVPSLELDSSGVVLSSKGKVPDDCAMGFEY